MARLPAAAASSINLGILIFSALQQASIAATASLILSLKRPQHLTSLVQIEILKKYAAS
jgi:hypothetical protein